ncbi:BrnT family toxin [Rhizobium sp. XQZ8]|uniref:BrnT family toxin n=1 Tax=Rhizobium populisoli TaxID=2859785 RepID=UPI001CA5B14A|nr:BrnT family toxin [Rhizobium populisoli]MBW6420994.1 BrnT family toxin [Rhizobium populisoli]
MKIVWDERKRIANITKHDLDFGDLTFEFFISAVTVPAKRGRYKAIGKLKDGTIAAIFVVLGSEALSVISMRPARKDERSLIE